MNDKDTKELFSKETLIDAEIIATWACLLRPGESNQKIYILAQSIIFKLQQAHYHLIQAIRYSSLSINELGKISDKDRQYYNFVTNCNFDSMIYALNSVMDIIAKLLEEIYSELNLKCKYFKKFETNADTLEALKEEDPGTASIIQSILTLEEREYVRKYCNENKHERAFFSASSYFHFDIDNEKITRGYNPKKSFKGGKEEKELSKYAPIIFHSHIEKICELGKSILAYEGLEPMPVNADFLKLIEMSDNNYYR